MAVSVWSAIPVAGYSATQSGTLGDTTITVSNTGAGAVMASGSSDYNGYNIWDNAAAANSAQIWPATAAGQIQLLVGANTGLNHITAKFGRPLINPQMLVYSLDNSYVDLSSTLTAAGTPAILSLTKNPAATYDAALKRLGSIGGGGTPEGCASTGGRGCAVVTFIGTYSQLDMVIQTTFGNNDGIGLQFGVDPTVEARMRPVPTLSQWGLMLMALLLAGTAGGLVRRRQNIR